MHQYDIISYDKVIDTNNSYNLFSSVNWIEVLRREYNFEFYYAYNKDRKDIVIPFAKVKNLKGSLIISLPFSDYIDTNDIDIKEYICFVSSLRENFPNFPFIFKTTYNETIPNISIIRNAFYHTIDLKNKLTYTSSFKRGIASAERNCVKIIQSNTLNGLEQFYSLYANLRIKKFNSIPQPFSFFRNIYDVYICEGRGNIFSAMHDGIIIASIIVLQHNNTLYYKFGASDTEKLHLRPNNLIFDYLVQYGKIIKADSINLGLSGDSDNYQGLRRFKESMGGVKKPITYYRIDPEGYDNSHEKIVSSLLQKYTSSLIENNTDLKKLDSISRLIYRNFA